MGEVVLDQLFDENNFFFFKMMKNQIFKNREKVDISDSFLPVFVEIGNRKNQKIEKSDFSRKSCKKSRNVIRQRNFKNDEILTKFDQKSIDLTTHIAQINFFNFFKIF